MSDALVRGFAEPTQQSQQVFRLIMKAMSEPGVVVSLPTLNHLAPLDSASYGTILSLLDNATPLWLSTDFDQPAIRKSLHFYTGVPFTASRSDSHFALAFGKTISELNSFPKGSAEYPENGATLVLLVDHINSGTGAEFILSGPGIPAVRNLQIGTISSELTNYLIERPDEFPCGLDIIFCCNEKLVCIPRSTVVKAHRHSLETKTETQTGRVA